VDRDHPFITYSPWVHRSYCRCGERQVDGDQPQDMRAKWELFHDHEPGKPCLCYVSAGRPAGV
jgi:hypothetical protein